MSDPRSALQSRFEEQNRFTNFGEVICRMSVTGFRCHRNTFIEILSPITAFCGMNGTGKSTLLQLAASAYVPPDSNWPRYYINSFLVVGTLDPTPFTNDARVEFKYWGNDRNVKTLTITRRVQTRRWEGYTRRPVRVIYFGGVGAYLPPVEKWDFFVRNANKLAVDRSEEIEEQVKSWTSRIMGQHYDGMHRNSVSFSERRGVVTSLRRGPIQYSESHMGCGEGRVQHIVNVLEHLPDKSLALIEEPETSLHAHAQHELGFYLVDVATRRGHQILMTTHSDYLLESLPSQSRVYLHSSAVGVSAIPGLPAAQAKSLMTRGNQKALHVLVEDDVAAAMLTEIIRRIDPQFLATIGIYESGGVDTIRTAIRTIAGTGLRVAAVLDGDQEPSPRENIFRLPAGPPPERQLFASQPVQAHVLDKYDLNLQDFSAGLAQIDHHQWCDRLSQRLNMDRTAMIWELAKAFANGVPEVNASALVQQVQEASRR